jgi:hypothetical protein
LVFDVGQLVSRRLTIYFSPPNGGVGRELCDSTGRTALEFGSAD